MVNDFDKELRIISSSGFLLPEERTQEDIFGYGRERQVIERDLRMLDEMGLGLPVEYWSLANVSALNRYLVWFYRKY